MIYSVEYRCKGYTLADAFRPNPLWGKRFFTVDTEKLGTEVVSEIEDAARAHAPDGYEFHTLEARMDNSSGVEKVDSDQAELLPCKCGGKLHVTWDRMGLATNAWVRCLACDTEVYAESGGRAAAIEKWNTDRRAETSVCEAAK